MELTLKMMPENPEKAKEFVDEMVNNLKDIPNMENYDIIKNVAQSNEKGNVAELVKEVSTKNGKNI